jgi:PAS domain-containing protein
MPEGPLGALGAARSPVALRVGDTFGRRKDGTTFPLDLAVGEFHFRGRRAFTAVVRDITERKKAEEQRKRRHRTLTYWRAYSPSGTYALDGLDGMFSLERKGVRAGWQPSRYRSISVLRYPSINTKEMP